MPVACRILTATFSVNGAIEKRSIMFKYLSPKEATSVLAVKMEKYGSKISMPIITKKLQLINDKTNPLNAVEDAFFYHLHLMLLQLLY